jgi:hypothetical protein
MTEDSQPSIASPADPLHQDAKQLAVNRQSKSKALQFGLPELHALVVSFAVWYFIAHLVLRETDSNYEPAYPASPGANLAATL